MCGLGSGGSNHLSWLHLHQTPFLCSRPEHLIRKTGREDWTRRRAGASLVQVYSSMHKGASQIFILPSLWIIKYVIVFFKHLNFHEWLNISKLNNGTGTYDVTKLFPILKYLGIFVSQSYPNNILPPILGLQHPLNWPLVTMGENHG